MSMSPAKSRAGSELWLEVSREIFGGVTVVETAGGAVAVVAGAVAVVRAAGAESVTAGLALAGASAGAGIWASVVDIFGVRVVLPGKRGEGEVRSADDIRKLAINLKTHPLTKIQVLEKRKYTLNAALLLVLTKVKAYFALCPYWRGEKSSGQISRSQIRFMS